MNLTIMTRDECRGNHVDETKATKRFFQYFQQFKVHSHPRAQLKLSENKSLPSRENSKEKKALLITARLLNVENKRKKQVENAQLPN